MRAQKSALPTSAHNNDIAGRFNDSDFLKGGINLMITGLFQVFFTVPIKSLPHFCLRLFDLMALNMSRMGALKTQEWKRRDWKTRHHTACWKTRDWKTRERLFHGKPSMSFSMVCRCVALCLYTSIVAYKNQHRAVAVVGTR